VEVSAQGPSSRKEGTKPGKTRVYFVDYLRGALVSLVILHHTAITYGGSGSFYYTEPATDPVASLALTLFTNFNQAWFLGAFFLVSAYFTPGSFDRKGAKLFIKDRLIRLVIPLLVFFFALNPLTIYIAFYHMTSVQLVQQGITPPMGLNLTFISQSVGNGPLWFVELLLIFEFGYVIWRVTGTRLRIRNEESRPFPSARKVGAFILVLALTAYLWRIAVPVSAEVLGFPSLFDLPQYLGLFIVGLAAARSDWLMKMPDAMAKRIFRVALVASATLLPLSLIGTVVTSLGWGSLVGYGSLSSAIYAMWDSTFAVGMTMFAISFFRRRFNSPGRLWGFTRNFYAAYFLQATVIVTFSALILYPLHIESLLKFALAAVLIVPSTWGLAYLVRRIPYVDRVL
jgi:acyltransferase-like protein